LHLNPLQPNIYCMYCNLTIKKLGVCLQIVFMLFVWISEQRAIFACNFPVFVNEIDFVYCTVRTESVCALQVHFSLQGLICADDPNNFV